MPEAIVSVSNISRTFRTGGEDVAAIRSATCEVMPQDRIALFGPSGSGKSTLLQILGGLDIPTSGTIVWPAYRDETNLRRRRIAFVFQNMSLLPALTAVENIEVPLLLQNSGAAAARVRAMEALERLDLLQLAEKLPEELSGGQAQRVAFARALVGSPNLILADEPTGQLDYHTAEHLFDIVFPWVDEMQAALVIATHDRNVNKRLRSEWRMQHGILDVTQ